MDRKAAHARGCTCEECMPRATSKIPAYIADEFGLAQPTGTGIAPTVAADPNPKTLTGARKLPMLSVVPPASVAHEAAAMRYGAFEAPRVDGTKGYGPYNWRDQKIEAMTYIDAAMRHIMAYVDGEEKASDSGVHHLGHAKASLGILLDAIENETWIDNRPRVRRNAAARLFEELKRK